MRLAQKNLRPAKLSGAEVLIQVLIIIRFVEEKMFSLSLSRQPSFYFLMLQLPLVVDRSKCLTDSRAVPLSRVFRSLH